MPDWINSFLTIVFVLVACLMVFLILLQEGKGGGLAALGGTKAAGIEGVTNPIRRATGYLAAIFFVLAILIGILRRPERSLGSTIFPESEDTSALEATDEAKPEEAKAPAPAPVAPAVENKAAEPQSAVPTPEPAKAGEAAKAPPPAEPAKAGEPAKAPEPAKAGEAPAAVPAAAVKEGEAAKAPPAAPADANKVPAPKADEPQKQ